MRVHVSTNRDRNTNTASVLASRPINNSSGYVSPIIPGDNAVARQVKRELLLDTYVKLPD